MLLFTKHDYTDLIFLFQISSYLVINHIVYFFIFACAVASLEQFFSIG